MNTTRVRKQSGRAERSKRGRQRRPAERRRDARGLRGLANRGIKIGYGRDNRSIARTRSHRTGSYVHLYTRPLGNPGG